MSDVLPDPLPNTSPAKKSDNNSPLSLRLGHIAIAVPSLEQAVERWRSVLQLNPSPQQTLREHAVLVVFFDLENTRIELLQPIGEKSPLASFLAKNPKGGIHHICIEAQNINNLHSRLLKQNVAFANNAAISIGAHGNPVFFLHPEVLGGTLVEFEDSGSLMQNTPQKTRAKYSTKK